MRQLLSDLKCNKTRASEYFGVSRGTIYKWLAGSAPAHVINHLELLVSFQRRINELRGK